MTHGDTGEVPVKLEPRLLPIVVWPDERLSVKCEDVTDFDVQLKQLSLDMTATMQAGMGAGLAAPQVGVLLNVIIVFSLVSDTPQTFVNPQIIHQSEEPFEWNEGCLSVPGYFERRTRPNRIVVKYKDIQGKEHEDSFEGLHAFAIQHEIDHLNGKVFVDGLSQFKTKRVKDKILKTRKKQRRL